MLFASFISLAITALCIVLSLAFKIAGKLRLTLPLLYLLAAVVSTFFTRWTSENEPLVLLGLYILIGLVVLSWVYSLVKKIRNKAANRQSERSFEQFVLLQVEQARERGITLDSVRIDADGFLLYPETGEPIFAYVDA